LFFDQKTLLFFDFEIGASEKKEDHFVVSLRP
jgi:hypothetical protein